MISLILLVLFIFFQVADILTTWWNLKLKGRVEGNKFVKWIMDKLGVLPALIITKAIVIVMISCAYVYYDSLYLTIALGSLCIWYGWVLFHNLKMLKRN
jgi:hypothetical protein